MNITGSDENFLENDRDSDIGSEYVAVNCLTPGSKLDKTCTDSLSYSLS